MELIKRKDKKTIQDNYLELCNLLKSEKIIGYIIPNKGIQFNRINFNIHETVLITEDLKVYFSNNKKEYIYKIEFLKILLLSGNKHSI